MDNENTKTFSVEVTVSVQRIADLLCTAFEGGMSRAWCEIIKYQNPKNVKMSLLGATYTDLPLLGGAILCRDTYDETTAKKSLKLDGDAIRRGLRLMAEKSPGHFGDFMNENEDAVTGDVFLQLCLLGEVLYG